MVNTRTCRLVDLEINFLRVQLYLFAGIIHREATILLLWPRLRDREVAAGRRKFRIRRIHRANIAGLSLECRKVTTKVRGEREPE